MQRILASFKPATSNSWPELALQESAFVDGVDNVLHFATRRLGTQTALYARLVHDIAGKDLDINARDCTGMTALEIAIRKGDYEAVQVLRRAGASRSLCSSPGENLLHISMTQCRDPSITRELLSVSFTDGGTGVYTDSLEESIRLVTEILKTVRESVPLLEGYLLLHHILVSDQNGSIPPRSATLAFKTVVRSWEDSSQLMSTETMVQVALPCCELLLKSGADIFGVFDGRMRECSGRQITGMGRGLCTALADLILFHHCEPKLAMSVVENYSGTESERLAYGVLAPCPSRAATIDIDHLVELLGTILARWPHIRRRLLLFVLDSTPDALKLDFARTIVSSRPAPDIFRSEVDRWEIISRLVEIEESVRWPVCEAVLSDDPGFTLLSRTGAPFGFSNTPAALLQLASTTAYLDHLCITIKHHLEKENESSVWSSLYESHDASPFAWDGVRWRQDNRETGAREFQRCAIHVITSMMLQSNSALANDLPKNLRIRWALQLRRSFELPDLVIDSSLLMDAIRLA